MWVRLLTMPRFTENFADGADDTRSGSSALRWSTWRADDETSSRVTAAGLPAPARTGGSYPRRRGVARRFGRPGRAADAVRTMCRVRADDGVRGVSRGPEAPTTARMIPRDAPRARRRQLDRRGRTGRRFDAHAGRSRPDRPIDRRRDDRGRAR